MYVGPDGGSRHEIALINWSISTKGKRPEWGGGYLPDLHVTWLTRGRKGVPQ
jgi:hypothetical protein